MNTVRCFFSFAVLLTASLMVAQPQAQTTTPPAPPAQNTPSTFPPTPPTQTTPSTLPPDTAAPPPSQNAGKQKPQPGVSSDEARSEIQQKLQAERGLSSRNINVEVMKDAIVLSGSVPTENDRAVAQRIAQSYAGDKRVENRVVISTEDDMSKPQEHR